MSYGQKYVVYFRRILGGLDTFKIFEEGYSGAVTELRGTGVPCRRYLRGDNDEIEDRILRSEVRLRVNSLTNYALLNFFTYDYKQFKGEWYAGAALYWSGYLMPDYYTEPYITAPYEVELVFADGLGILKNIDFEQTSANGLSSLWDTIKYCLNKTLNILPVSEAVNVYEENHTQADNTTMLDQTYYNLYRFNDMKCYEVLDEVLKASDNAQLWQQDGRWFIVPLAERKKISYVRRNYSSAYAYINYDTISPQIEITGPTEVAASLNCFLDQPDMTILPAWKEFVLTQDLGYDNNLLRNKAFTKVGSWNASTDDDGFIYLDPADALPVDANYLQWDLGQVTQNIDDNEYLNVEFKCFGPHDIALIVRIILDTSGTDYSLSSAIDWNYANWEAGISHVLYQDRMDQQFNTKRTDNIPASGRMYLRIYQPWKMAGGTDFDGIIGFNVNDIKIFYTVNFDIIDTNTVTTELNQYQNYKPPVYEMMLGDLPYPLSKSFWWYPPVPIGQPPGFPYYRTITTEFVNQGLVYDGGLYRLSGDDVYSATRFWQRRGTTEKKFLVNLIADGIAVNHIRPTAMISGSLRCNFKPGTVIKAPISTDRLFMMKRFEENTYDNEWNVDLVEFAFADQGYVKLRTGGYVTLRGGGKIKLRQ